MADAQGLDARDPANGWLVFGAWAAAMLLGVLVIGPHLGERLEGVAGVPLWPVGILAVLVLVAIVLTIRWALRLQRNDDDSQPTPASGRRKFLTGGAALTGGALGVAGATIARVEGWARVTGPALRVQTEQTSPNPRTDWRDATVESYRPLGKTGLMVSDISLGSTRLHQNPDPVGLLNAALDRCINYIDASPDYAPESEQIIKAAIKGRDRSKLVIASKFCTHEGHVRAGHSVDQYIGAAEGALTRLGTDYLDVAHIHACDTINRLMDPNVHEAVDRLREQGKVRFMGVSTHTPDLELVANTAIDSGRFDVMMLAYHHGAWPNLRSIVHRAAREGIGIVAMKTLKGAKHKGLMEFRDEADSYTQAAFKWVLANPDVSNLVISVFENQHLDEYLYASGKSLEMQDLAILEKYDELIAGTHCFQHCNSCQSSCPAGVPIHDVLRHRMYFEDYGDEKQAMEGYAKLAVNAAACVDCSAPCAGGCPEGIPIQERTLGAHNLLTMA
ncbi:MAG: aldo/keto reductase [Pseudomonadota bacterium]